MKQRYTFCLCKCVALPQREYCSHSGKLSILLKCFYFMTSIQSLKLKEDLAHISQRLLTPALDDVVIFLSCAFLKWANKVLDKGISNVKKKILLGEQCEENWWLSPILKFRWGFRHSRHAFYFTEDERSSRNFSYGPSLFCVTESADSSVSCIHN